MTKASSASRVDLMFRAFSDRTRLRILHLLHGGELCVCDLVRVLSIPQPTASRHLAYLRKAGLVVARKAGLWSYYSLMPPQGEFHERLLSCIGSCFGDVPELKKDAERARKVRRDGGCCPEAQGGEK